MTSDYKIIISNCESSISIMFYVVKRSIATASVSIMDWYKESAWYINRVFVNDKLRGVGLGTRLVAILKEETIKRNGKVLVVEPGGYGSNPKNLKNFYVNKNGFVENKKDKCFEYELRELFNDQCRVEEQGATDCAGRCGCEIEEPIDDTLKDAMEGRR